MITIVMQSASNFAVPLMHLFYKPFSAPSESMAPTIDKGEKFIADMQWRGPFKRGEIIIFGSASGVRDYRIVGLPGDRIAMRGGRPVLNGEPVSQTAVGRTSFEGYDGAHEAAVFTERLPGEVSEHRVLDTGSTQFDDTQEFTVPAGHLFVLGDNRDSSADSRVPPDLGGVGMIPFKTVLGRPIYIHWSRNHAKVGARLDS